MTVSTSKRVKRHVGNGVTTQFPYDFYIPNEASLEVYLYDSVTGVNQLLNPSVYSVTGIGDHNFGEVTYPLSGPPITSTQTLTIRRVVEYTQNTSIRNQTGFFPEVIEDALDHLTFQTQQNAEDISRAIVAPLEEATDMTLPSKTKRASKVLGFDSNGLPVALSQLDKSADTVTALGSNTPRSLAEWMAMMYVQIESIAALRAQNSADPPRLARVLGYAVAGDMGGGVFYCDTTDTTSADNNGDIIVDAAGNRWKRIDPRDVLPEWFGDGTSDVDWSGDINSAINLQTTARAYTATHLVGKTYTITGQLVIDRGVALIGESRGRWDTPKTTIRSTTTEIGDGNYMAVLNTDDVTVNTADNHIEGIEFRGDVSVSHSDLNSATDSGVCGLDMAMTKNGLTIASASFRGFKTAIGQRTGVASTWAGPRLFDVTGVLNYRFLQATVSAPALLLGCNVRENVSPVDCNGFSIVGGVYENSSATDYQKSCIRVANAGQAAVMGAWFEGMSPTFQVDASGVLALLGNHISSRRATDPFNTTWLRGEERAKIFSAGNTIKHQAQRQVSLSATGATLISLCDNYRDNSTYKRYAYWPNSSDHPFNKWWTYCDEHVLGELTKLDFVGRHNYYHGSLAAGASVTVDVVALDTGAAIQVYVTGYGNGNLEYVNQSDMVLTGATGGNYRVSSCWSDNSSNVTVSYAVVDSVVQVTIALAGAATDTLRNVNVRLEAKNIDRSTNGWNRAPKLKRDFIDNFVDTERTI